MKTDTPSMVHGYDTFMNLKDPSYLKKINSGGRTNAASVSVLTQPTFEFSAPSSQLIIL